MDPRSAAAKRLGDPRGARARLSEQASAALPNLQEAREFTANELEAKRQELGSIAVPKDVSVVLFGSWARKELTPESDDDWAVIVETTPGDRADVSEVEEAARGVLGVGERKPGSQDIFGVAFGCDELVEQVGLDEDLNTIFTRRMLLLLESAPLLGEDAHRRCWERVLDTYVQRGAKNYRIPRFLLNDLVRYWRTICVDFEGKHWDSADDPKWVTRNAKLRTSRKLLFASGLIPVLGCSAVTADEQFEFLRQQFAAVPTDRLAEAFLEFDDGANIDAGVRGLRAYDRFLGMLADGDVREELRQLRADTRGQSAVWREIKSLGDELQESLLALLFGPALSSLTKHHAIF
jgi:predicted nucleotidyltransferase